MSRWKRQNGRNRQRRTTFSVMLAAILIVIAVAQRAVAQETESPVHPAEPDARNMTDPEPTSAVAGQDRAEELRGVLSGLDPKMFNGLIGAEIDLEVVGDQVILQGPSEAVATIELLIRLLDESKDQKALEVVRVEKRDATEIARSIEQPLREMLRDANQLAVDDVTITALSPSILLVGALPKDIDFVLAVIRQVDEEEELPPVEQLVFPVKHLKASDAAEQLKTILTKINQKRGQAGDQAEIQVVPNNANNTIMVIAPETQRETIRKLLEGIDVEPQKGWGEVKLTIFPLLHSTAADLSTVITDLLASPDQREAAQETIFRLRISKALPSGEVVDLAPIDLQKPTRIIADDGTNSLILATVEENVGPVGELIRLLDGVPLAEDVRVHLFPLRFADAQSVADTVSGVFDNGKTLTEDPDGSGADAVPPSDDGRSLVYNIGISADVRTNTVIVAGRGEQLKLIQTIIDKLDRPVNALKFPLRLIELEYSDATHVAQIITELTDQRFEAAQSTGATASSLERERVFISVDIRSNTLIVSASEENFAEIGGIARQLDTQPARLFEQIRIVPCEHLSARDIKEKIDELWQRKASLRQAEELLDDTPVIVADERSNVLIVASSVEDFEEIQQLVETLESQPRVGDMDVFKLDHADATLVADMLDELFQGIAGQSDSFEAPTVLPDPRSNSLVVAGSRDTMERVAQFVSRVDIKAGPMTSVFKVYTLEHGSASKLAPRIQELFDSREEGTEISRTPIVILSDETSNSLVCSASQDDHEILVDLLRLLDRPSTISGQVKMFPLKMAKANNVAETLNSVFESQGEGSTTPAGALSINADERTNTLIVWASPTEMLNIGEMIARLDTVKPAVEMTIKVVQLKQALAEDFAQLLDSVLLGDGGEGDDQRAIIVSFLEKDERGRETARKLLRQDIRIEPDPRTNSLMVMAPADSMAMLEAMIRDFDRIRPVTSEIRLFNLFNSDAGAMVDQLTELFEAGGAGGGDGETQSQLVFGSGFEDINLATVGQELRFTADPRTNTLMAAGSAVYLKMVEDLVAYLDAQEAENRVVQVVQAKYRPATDLANAVQGFVDQELNVLGEGDDEESRLRRMERQVSVEAIGNEEQGSSSLLVGTSRRAYQRTMEMIEMLDQPEPQVMISVLIAEVSLSDNLSLGIELAGQDLDFTEGAIQGPNGTIQGSGFDYVVGVATGAANSLGFSFTLTGEDFSFLLSALQTNSRLEVLSRPNLLVRNGEEGNITIADQVPIVSDTRLNDTGQTQSTISSEDVGIVLTATPQISPDGYVTIALRQEISNVKDENIQLTEGVSSPVFSTREVETNVTVRDGETVLIGGLIQTRLSDGETKVPILGDLPFIGPLFRTTNVSETRTELLLVLTVDIVRNADEVREMSVHQRNLYKLPTSIVQNPLMEGLRIVPDNDIGMGPRDREPSPTQSPPSPKPERTDERYGPKPKPYGPAAPTPSIVTPTSTAMNEVYGPKIVQGDTVVAGN